MNLDSATITSGNLEAAPLGSMVWSDSSDPANPISIDLNTYKIVPGDTITSTQDIDMALEGDNILASFDLDFALASSGDLLAGLEITYDIVDENGVEVVPETAYDTAATQFIVGESDVTPDLDSTKDYTVRIKVVFPDTTINRDYTEVNAILNSAQIHVKQVRSASGSGGSTVVNIGYNFAMGENHTLALQSDGTLKAWGSNAVGQLGVLNTTQLFSPTIVPNIMNVKQITAGRDYSMALLHTGEVFAWGGNNSGKLGFAHTNAVNQPTLVPGVSNVKKIRAGYEYSVVLFNDGLVKTAGDNTYGQRGTSNLSLGFVLVDNLSNVVDIETGAHHSLFILDDGSVKGVGYNVYGQLATGVFSVSNGSVVSTLLSDVKSLSCGYYHCFAIQNDDDVYAWGNNDYGQLGVAAGFGTPTLLNSLGNITDIQGFSFNTFIKNNNGDKYLWGFNSYGVVGNGTTTHVTSPTISNMLNSGDEFFSSGLGQHAFIRKADGSWMGVGLNNYGQLGIGNNSSIISTPQALSVSPM